MPSCAACGEFGMNCSMISRRVGISFTRAPYSESEQGPSEGDRRAWVDAMLLLELPLEAVVEEREQELLPARPELARRPVERRQRDVLKLAGDAADVGQVAVLARVANGNRLPGAVRVRDAVSGGRHERGDAGHRHGWTRDGRGRAEGAR